MAQFIKKGLYEVGYAVDIAEDAATAKSFVAQSEYDLMILDVMLPDGNGMQLVKQFREDGFLGPILMLTAMSTTQNKLDGFNAGADDYLTKPYSFEELLARIRSLLRRSSTNPTSTHNYILKYADLELDLLQRKVKRKNQDIQLTAKEFGLLEYFMRNAERPLGRVAIAEHVWDIHFDSESNVIDVYVNLLRKKVDAPFDRRLIHTVVGVGYVLKV